MILSANDFFRTVPRAGLPGALFSFSPGSSPGALSVGALPFFARTGSPGTAFFLFLCETTKLIDELHKKP